MQDRRVTENCKFVTLDSGLQLPYCEFGEENDEVIVAGAFYFMTFNTFLKELAKKYRVIGVIMRNKRDGEAGLEYEKDGTVNWIRQWGRDIYQATQKLGIEKFHYVGKCHGAAPGWALIKEHPEVLLSLSSLSLTLHSCKQDKNDWVDQMTTDPQFMLKAVKKHKMLPLKAQEAQIVGVNLNAMDTSKESGSGDSLYYGSHPEAVFDSLEEVNEFIPTIKTPVFQLFGTDDMLYHDFKTANEASIYAIPGVRTVFLQGERHFPELDYPILFAKEIEFFIERTKMPYA